MNILNEYIVAYKHLQTEEPDNQLGKEISGCA